MKTYKNGKAIEPQHHKEAQAIIAKIQKAGNLKKIHNYGAYDKDRFGTFDSEFTEGGFRFVYLIEKFIPISFSSVGKEQEAYAIYYEYIGE